MSSVVKLGCLRGAKRGGRLHDLALHSHIVVTDIEVEPRQIRQLRSAPKMKRT